LWLIAAGKGEERTDKPLTAVRDQSVEQGENAATSFGPIRTTSAFARGQTRVATAPWYLALLALGPLGWFLLLTTSLVRQSLVSRAQKAGPQRAAREAKRRLSEASIYASQGDARRCYAELAAAIVDLLEARLGAPVSGYTRVALREHLTAKGMPEPLVAKTIAELEAYDIARFSAAGSDAENMKRSVERTNNLLKELSSFTPKRG
jgi:hypothetical protein